MQINCPLEEENRENVSAVKTKKVLWSFLLFSHGFVFVIWLFVFDRSS